MDVPVTGLTHIDEVEKPVLMKACLVVVPLIILDVELDDVGGRETEAE